MDGLEFTATLNIRTKLDVLKRHGEVFCGLPSEAPEYGSEADGIWIPKLKSWESLGIEGIEEFPEGTSSSDIGYVNASEYLPFLIDFRVIVESGLDVPTKIKKMEELSQVNQTYKEFWGRLCVTYPDFPNHFFYKQFTEIPRIGIATAKKIYDAGIISFELLETATDERLSAINGIGKNAVEAIRKYLKARIR